MTIIVKRAYDRPEPSDGFRVLVDRLWPRGLSKQKLKLDAWMKELAPSNELRRWIHDDESRWPEFEKRYRAELRAHRELVEELRAKGRSGKLTLVFASRNMARNNATVLKSYLERK